MRLMSKLWSKISDAESALHACRRGAWGAWWGAASVLGLSALMLLLGIDIFGLFSGGEIEMLSEEEKGIILVTGVAAFLAIIVIGALTRTGNRVAAILLFCMMIAELGYGIASATGRVTYMAIALTVLSFNGVRGSFAYHMYTKREAFREGSSLLDDQAPTDQRAMEAIEAAASGNYDPGPYADTDVAEPQPSAPAEPRRAAPNKPARSFGRRK